MTAFHSPPRFAPIPARRCTRPLARWAAALLTVSAIGCGGGSQPDESASVIEAPPVMVVAVSARDVVDRIEATGQLLAQARAAISAQVGGQITAISFEEGDAVEAGQEVLEIDPERHDLERRNAVARVEEARAAHAEAKRELARLEKLRTHASASESQYDVAVTQLALARSRLAGAEAQLGLAERALRDSTVTVPFTGHVARRHVSAGEFVTAGQQLLELVDVDPLEVEFHLAEIDSSRVALAQQVDVRVSPLPGRVFRGEVSVVSPTIDPTTRTLRVRALVDNRSGALRPGLFARVDLGVAHRESVATVPEDAVLQRADGTVVFRMVGDDRVERVAVRTGVHRDGWIEIADGLAVGDVVVVRGQSGLVEGARVSVRNPDGTPAGAGLLGDAAPGAASLHVSGGAGA